MVASYRPQDIAFICDVYQSVARGHGIEPVLTNYTSHYPDIRFTWQAMCVSTREYFAICGFNYDDAAWDEYMPIKHLNEVPALTAQLPMDTVVKSEQILTTAEYENTDIYNLFFRQRDELNSSLGLWAHREGRNAAFMGVDVPRRYPDDEREELEISLATILPHLQGAFSLMLDLDVRRQREEQARVWLETLPSAAFIVSAAGRASRWNEAAARLMQAEGGPSVTGSGQLSFASTEQKEAVETPLRRALVTLESEGPFAIPSPGTERLSGYCVPLPTGMQDDAVLNFFHGSEREALLVIVDAADIPAAPPDVLSETLGITRAEARIVSQLCEGGDLREAADAFGVSYNTARTQLASAAGKLGVARQTEIVAAAVNVLARLKSMPRN